MIAHHREIPGKSSEQLYQMYRMWPLLTALKPLILLIKKDVDHPSQIVCPYDYFLILCLDDMQIVILINRSTRS